MSSETQSFTVTNPPRRSADARPGLGLIGGMLAFMAAAMPPAMIAALVIGPGRRGHLTIEIDPLVTAALSRNFLPAIVIACVAGLANWSCAWLLWRGNSRRDLWRAVFCFWLANPGQILAFALLHWFSLWRDNVGIYDLWLRLQDIGSAVVLAVVVSAYLLRSRRMRRRFSPAADLAAVF